MFLLFLAMLYMLKKDMALQNPTRGLHPEQYHQLHYPLEMSSRAPFYIYVAKECHVDLCKCLPQYQDLLYSCHSITLETSFKICNSYS